MRRPKQIHYIRKDEGSTGGRKLKEKEKKLQGNRKGLLGQPYHARSFTHNTEEEGKQKEISLREGGDHRVCGSPCFSLRLRELDWEL